MAGLITLEGPSDWAEALYRRADRIGMDQDATISDILSTFGGMGSLNDIVLYREHQPLVQANTELDALRRRLYALCHEAAQRGVAEPAGAQAAASTGPQVARLGCPGCR